MRRSTYRAATALLTTTLATALAGLGLAIGAPVSAAHADSPRPEGPAGLRAARVGAGPNDGSIVFVRGNQVWISDAAGGHARRLTTQGTAAKPFQYPSEDDHGHIVAIRGNGLVVLDQAGRVLHSYAQPMANTGTIDHASISPDGSVLAYSVVMLQNECDPYGCGSETLHEVYYLNPSSGRQLSGPSGSDPNTGEAETASWVSNRRSVMSGLNSVVDYQDRGEQAALWYRDCDEDVWNNCPDQPGSTYWNVFPSVNRTGTRYAGVVIDLKYAGPDARTTFLNIMDTSGFGGGTPAQPTARCPIAGLDTPSSDGFPSAAQATVQTPSWGPDGRSLVVSFQGQGNAWQVWRVDTGSDVRDCSAYTGGPILDNATQPRWSPAPLASPTTVRLASAHRIRRGHRLTVTVRVSAGATGRVVVYDGKRVLGRPTLHGGVARVRTRRLTVGRHRLHAAYAGSRTRLPSRSGTFTVRVLR